MRLTSSLHAWFCAVSPFHGITARPASRGFGVVLFALVVGVVFLGTGNAQAQPVSEVKDSNGNTILYMDEGGGLGGFVGVNRISSIGREVFGVRANAGAGSYGGMYVETTTANGWPFYGYATNGSSQMWTYYDGSTDKWHVWHGGNRLTVQSNGNVGIGTTSPGSPLTVDGMVESTTGGITLPDGTVIDESSDVAGGLSLPFSGSTSNAGPVFEVENTGSGDAISIPGAGADGIDIRGPGNDGIRLDNAGNDGLDVRNPTNDGLRVTGAGADGIQSNGATNFGVLVENAGDDGVRVNGASDDGVEVRNASYGLFANSPGDTGVLVNSPGNVGVRVNNSANEAVEGNHSSGNLGELGTADYGVHGVSTASQDNAGYFEMSTSSGTALVGIHRGDGHATYGFVEGAGNAVLGQTDPNSSGDAVVGSALGSGFAGVFETSQSQGASNPNGHVVLVENTGGSNADGLAVQAGPNANPGSATNFLTFYDGDGDAVGAIEGDGSGGITRKSGGSDYAEELPVAKGKTKPEAKDLVGVHGGKASLGTRGADRVMVASSAPILTGNATPGTEADDSRRVAVAFIGQVPVRLRGDADVGDLIVASGHNDGTARAVAPGEYRRSEHGPIAGQAWSAKTASGIGEVTVAVGLGRSGAVAKRLQEQQEQIASLRERIQQVETLQERVARLEAQSSGGSVLAGLSDFGLLLGLLAGGLLGAGVVWRRRS